MSENQQPLDEEQSVSDVQEQEVLPAVNEDTLPAEQEETAPAENEALEEEEDIDPADMKIFGMPRRVFHFTCFGAAAGYILCGLVGIWGEKVQGTALGDILAKSPSATAWAVVIGAIGYILGNRVYKKQAAAREAEKAALEQPSEENNA